MPRKSSSRHFTPLTSQHGLTFQRLRHYGPPSDEPSQFHLGLTQFDSPARVVTTGRGAARKRRGYSKSVSEKKERRREGRHKSREKSRPARKEGEFVLELELEEGQENASPPRPNAKKGGDGWESDDEGVSSPEKGPSKQSTGSKGGDKMEVDGDSDATRSLAGFGGNGGGLSFGEDNNAGEGGIGEPKEGGEGDDSDEEASSDDESAPVQKRRLFPSTTKKPAAKKRRVIREEDEDEEEDSIMLEELAVDEDEEVNTKAKADMATRRSRQQGARTPMLEEEESESGEGGGLAQGVPFTQAPAARGDTGTTESESDEDSSDDEMGVPPLTQALEPTAGTRRSRRLRQTKEEVGATVDRDAPADEDSECEFTAEAVMAESEAEETVASAPTKTKGGRGRKATKAGEGEGTKASTVRKGKAGSAKKAPVAVRKKPASNFERFVVPAAAKCAAEEASVAASEAEASKAKKNPRKTQAGQKKKAASAKEQAKARRDELDFDEDEESTVVEASDEESAYEPTQGEGKAKTSSPRPARRSSSRARKGPRNEAVAADPARSPKAPRRRKKAKGAKEDDASALEEQIAAEVSASERKVRSAKAGAGKLEKSGAAGAPKGRDASTKTPEVVEEPRRRTRSSRAKQSKAVAAGDDEGEDEGRKVRRGSSKGRDESAKALELEEDVSSGRNAGRKTREGRDTRSKRAQKEVVESDDEEEQPVVNADDGDFGGDGGFEVEYGYPEAEVNEGEQTQNVMPFTQAPGSDDAEEEGSERGLELGKGEETTKEVRSIELTTRSFAEDQPHSRSSAGPSLSVDPLVANQKEARNDATATIELSTRNMKMDQSELLAALQTQQETLTRSQLSSAVSPEPTASTMGGSSFGGEATMQDTEGSRADGSTVAPKGMKGDKDLHQRLSYHLSEAQNILGQMLSSRTG